MENERSMFSLFWYGCRGEAFSSRRLVFIFACLKLYKARAWLSLNHFVSSLSLHVWGNFCSCTSRLGFYWRGKRSNLLIGSCNQSSREISVNWKLVSFLLPPTSLRDHFFFFSHISWALSATRVLQTNGTPLSENILGSSRYTIYLFETFNL
jgi:hypothetical protein